MTLRAIHPGKEQERRVECPLCGAVEDPQKQQQHTEGICRQRVVAQRTYWERRALAAEEKLYRWAEYLHPMVEEIHELPPRK